jgi:Flp pilus assembly protein TadB
VAIDLAPVVKFVRSRTNAKGRTVDLGLAAMIVVVGLAAVIVVVGLAAVIVVVGLAAVIVVVMTAVIVVVMTTVIVNDSRDRRSRSRDRHDDSRASR